MCRVILFINKDILSTVSYVSIQITLLHVRRFTPVSVIRIHLMRQVMWFINRWSRSLVQVWQLYVLINRDAKHKLLLISIIHSPRVVRILFKEIIVVLK
ncbi:hypothetical protein Hanom_Chr00s000591g01650981 [Helianthus anomalus]